MMNLKNQSGFSLMEILISLFVLSIGLLGLAGLQLGGMQSTKSAQSRTFATLAAYDIVDRMRSNPDGISGGDYDSIACTSPGSAQSCISSSTGCSSSELSINDLYEWCTNSVASLPGSSATVVESSNIHTVTVAWAEASDADDPDKSISVNVRF